MVLYRSVEQVCLKVVSSEPSGALSQKVELSITVSGGNRAHIFLGVSSIGHNGISGQACIGGKSKEIWGNVFVGSP